ncbi:site-specific integrase [Thermoactinomyces sp. DSM 45892]|uniref:site-specific integrase n=1 Tax=Thermoactinomyces sp. DSM 45892 TaxID=1882753 RepID=UPI0008993929|nr:site-specific integrase [Thermoactinomyces sp. DSM 45892]SDZ12407.1 Site-specific recombinase XerD [Thermoactinomyces sp. DSM 45892]
MRGHIRKDGNKYCFVIDIGRDPETGNRRQEWFYGFDCKKDAQKEMISIIHQINQGTYSNPQRTTLIDYLQVWLRDYAKVNTAPLTYEGYEYIVTSHILPTPLAEIPLNDLKPLDIQGYYSRKLENGKKDGSGGLSAKSVYSHHRLLHEALEHAVRWQMIDSNPMKSVIPPRPKRKHFDVLTREQIHFLLQEAKKSKFYYPIYFAIHTGMRRGEILGLKWQDVDLTNQVVSVRRSVQRVNGQGIIFKDTTKNDGSRRTVAISSSVIETLRTIEAKQSRHKQSYGIHYQDYGLVFANDNGSPFDPDGLSRGFRRLVKNLEIPHIRFHDLRHSHATLLIQQGEHPKVISERLGHSTITVTMDTYSHVMPHMQKEAVRKWDDFLYGGQDEPYRTS